MSDMDPLWERAEVLFPRKDKDGNLLPNNDEHRFKWIVAVQYLRASKKGWVADSEEARAATFQGDKHLSNEMS